MVQMVQMDHLEIIQPNVNSRCPANTPDRLKNMALKKPFFGLPVLARLALLILSCYGIQASAQTFQWDGSYAGITAGAYRAENKWTTTAVAPSISAGVTVGANPQDHFDASTKRLAALAGYNWRLGDAWLMGLEADFGNGGATSPIRLIPGSDITVGGTQFTTNRPYASFTMDWDASLRGRLGYLLSPDTLLQGSVGFAWQQVKVSAACVAGAICTNAHNESLSKTLSGWTLGFGLEHRLQGHWLVRADYRYADFGSLNHTFFTDGFVFNTADDRFFTKVNTRTQLFNLGLVYKF